MREGRASGEEDEVERSVLVLISELDGRLAYTARRVVVTSDIAVSNSNTHTRTKYTVHRPTGLALYGRDVREWLSTFPFPPIPMLSMLQLYIISDTIIII